MFVQDFAGLEINEKIQLQFCKRIPKLSCNLEKLLKMANDQKNATAPVHVFNAMFERSNMAAKLSCN